MDVRRVIAPAAVVAIICSLAWVLGFDFNERGEAAFVVAWLSFSFGALAAFYPFSERK